MSIITCIKNGFNCKNGQEYQNLLKYSVDYTAHNLTTERVIREGLRMEMVDVQNLWKETFMGKRMFVDIPGIQKGYSIFAVPQALMEDFLRACPLESRKYTPISVDPNQPFICNDFSISLWGSINTGPLWPAIVFSLRASLIDPQGRYDQSSGHSIDMFACYENNRAVFKFIEPQVDIRIWKPNYLKSWEYFPTDFIM